MSALLMHAMPLTAAFSLRCISMGRPGLMLPQRCVWAGLRLDGPLEGAGLVDSSCFGWVACSPAVIGRGGGFQGPCCFWEVEPENPSGGSWGLSLAPWPDAPGSCWNTGMTMSAPCLACLYTVGREMVGARVPSCWKRWERVIWLLAALSVTPNLWKSMLLMRIS